MMLVSKLKAHKTNPRKHSKAQIRQLADSIASFGFLAPVLIDDNHTILAGHGRVAAAKLLGMTEVPTLKFAHLSDAQKKAYRIADNRLAEKSSWDDEALALELQDLLKFEETEFEISAIGFDMPEIELKVQSLDDEDPDAGDEIPKALPHIVTRKGDIWQMGDHRVICGDSLDSDTYSALLGKEKMTMVLTDPPYNVPIKGHVSGLGKVVHEEFAMASGEMTEKQFYTFLRESCENMASVCADGAILFMFMDWRHIAALLGAGDDAALELKNICVWNKDNGGMGSLYRSKHELVAVFKKGKANHINNVALGRYGRNRTNVWNYRGVNTLRNGREDELAMHPTVKPVRMLADAIQDCSNPGDYVLDAFGGSGSTLIAAERMGRKARLIEMDPKYVDVAVRRWQALTGKDAINALTGKTFDAQMELTAKAQDGENL
ncbi:MAG: DNA methylase N-4 [Blastochloris viridis]|uniref:Methyltransferase n=1 Tax=Blastochloris viridis TaxID=1079 RepID=A0A6N4RFV4_BLAVI|nr:MAG: DNA methylase N-4 [Blastochloris viridis]